MSLPTAAEVAARAGVGSNDPRAPVALAVALDWARGALGLAADDDLSGLNAAGNEAVLGYAADVVKLPAAQSALFDPENSGPAVLPFDLSRRWGTLLGPANKHVWAIR